MTPTFTVLIGSAGRDTLRYTLESIARQPRIPGDQVIVAFDSLDHDSAWVSEQTDAVRTFGEGFLACAYESGYHWLGVEQINYALRAMPITGTHIFTLGDDDVFTDDAYATLRPLCAEQPQRPILYRFKAPWDELLWDVPQMRMSRISGCCIAAPRAFVGPMPTRQYVEHDFDWMQGILQAAPVAPLWLDRVLVLARPPRRGDDVAHQGILVCWHCQQWRYLEDLNILEPHCPACGVVVDLPRRPASSLATTRLLAAHAAGEKVNTMAIPNRAHFTRPSRGEHFDA